MNESQNELTINVKTTNFTSTTIRTLTKQAKHVLDTMKSRVEGYEINEDGKWGLVYLPNVQGFYGSKSFSGICSSLSQAGLYRPYGDQFGLVRMYP